MDYNYDQWGGVRHVTISNGDYSSVVSDGVHRVTLDSQPIDILVSGLSTAKRNDRVLFFFGGAIKSREDTKGPFFSGMGIREKVGAPVISISDPALEAEPGLRLGWYLAGQGTKHLPETIAKLIDGISTHFAIRPVLVGGSGGGFGILNVQQHMEVAALSLIWNPQIDISKYIIRFAAQFINSASPRNYRVETPEEAKAALEELALPYNLAQIRLRAGELLYLQNAKDHHVDVHLRPFMAHGSWEPAGKGGYLCRARGVRVVLGDWGDGHAALPRLTMIELIKQVMKGANSADLGAYIQRQFPLQTEVSLV